MNFLVCIAVFLPYLSTIINLYYDERLLLLTVCVNRMTFYLEALAVKMEKFFGKIVLFYFYIVVGMV